MGKVKIFKKRNFHQEQREHNFKLSTSSNNSVKLLLDGAETFAAITEALSNAQHRINLEYFIFSDDEIGRKIKNILSERARSGVKVRVIFDALGSWRLGRNFISDLRNAGVNVHVFLPPTLFNLRLSLTHRDHRKIITVDGHTGLLGGLNIGDVYLKRWRDTHLQIKGEAVAELDRIFFRMWDRLNLKKNKITPEELNSKIIDISNISFSNSVPVKIAASGPNEEFRIIADEYIKIISNAKNRLWITTPYLVPDEKLLNALYLAASKNVDVRIIIPFKANHTLVSWASQYNIDRLLEHGIRIFVYQDRFIHAKTLISDRNIASVGTTNLDMRSLEMNYEVQAFVYSAKLVAELENAFLNDLSHCSEEKLNDRLRNRSLLQKLQAKIGKFWSAVL